MPEPPPLPPSGSRPQGTLRKHSATLHGHRTSFTLEAVFWLELKRIAAARSMPLARLIAEIDDTRPPESNLSSALRVHVLAWVKAEREPVPDAKNSKRESGDAGSCS